MLYSVELGLRVVAGGNLRRATGYHVYSFFLALMERAAPSLSALLHRDASTKPFTLSPLSPEGGTSGRARLRLTFLQDEVFACFNRALLRPGAEMTFPLGEARVVCESVATTPEQSPYAAFTTFEALAESAAMGRRIALAFLSPTTFRSKGQRNTLLPEPSLVLGSLLNRWNAFAPPSASVQLRDSALRAVRLVGHRLGTQLLGFDGYREAGFVGYATYEVEDSLPTDEVRVLQALGDFAFFSGVGAKTTMGMGQARRIYDAKRVSNHT